MKKIIVLLYAVCLIVCLGTGHTAYAAEANLAQNPTNVNITVMMPEKGAETTANLDGTPSATATASIHYPSNVEQVRTETDWTIIKTYELGTNDNPNNISRMDFEQNGWLFKLSDVLCTETANTETREHTETILLNTETNDLESIVPLLPHTKEFESEDGYTGILSLDMASIKVEAAGTEIVSDTLSLTREYPHLSANDTELVPKTVTEDDLIYHLVDVTWEVGNYSAVDYERIPDYYTAFATYTATDSRSEVIGYTTTAEYKGTLAKMVQGKTLYTAYFIGTEIVTPLEFVMPGASETSTDENEANTSKIGLWCILLAIAAILGGAYYFMKGSKKNGKSKTNHHSFDVARNDADDL